MSSLPLRSPLWSDDPRRLGRYTLSGRLGRGAQGVVYLARTPDGRMVALKLLHEDRTARPGSRKRLAKEAATARRVRGRCTARILDVDVSGPRPYIVSEYVAGPSLHRRVRERGPLGGAALDRLMIGTATALVAIHSAGIVHRDLKPANVLLGPEGPRVIDFGVAHVEDATTTLTGAPIGTPAYMAPEQVAGGAAGCPADVFSWASTMVYAATGQAPFGRDNAPAVMHRIAHAAPDLTGLRGHVLGLLTACLEKDAAARPSAEDVLRRLLELGTRRATARSRNAILAAGTRAASPQPHRDRPDHQHADRPRADGTHPDRPRPARQSPDDQRSGPRRPGRTPADGTPPDRRAVPEPRRTPRPSEPRGGGQARARDRDEQSAGMPAPAARARPAASSRRARPGAERDRTARDRAGRDRSGRERAVRDRLGRDRAAGGRGEAPGEGAMSPGRRRGYAIAVIITMLVGLTLGIMYPWANPDGGTSRPAPSATATP